MNTQGTPKPFRLLNGLAVLAGLTGFYSASHGRHTDRVTMPAAKQAATPGDTDGKGTTARAQKRGKDEPGNLDRRAVSQMKQTVEGETALAELRVTFPGVDVQFDPVTGSANHLMAAGRNPGLFREASRIFASQISGAHPEMKATSFRKTQPRAEMQCSLPASRRGNLTI